MMLVFHHLLAHVAAGYYSCGANPNERGCDGGLAEDLLGGAIVVVLAAWLFFWFRLRRRRKRR